MTWNYRVMRRRQPLPSGEVEEYYGIHEVYTEHGWTQNPVDPFGESLEDLHRSFERMAKAFDLPVLDHETGLPISHNE